MIDAPKTLYYAGIGPRKVDRPTQDIATSIAQQLSSGKTIWWLRSGFARGLDQAFGRGAIRHNIFLPWEGYNKGYSNNLDKGVMPISRDQMSTARHHYEKVNARDIAEGHKPKWLSLKQETIQLMCRNVPIILGEDLKTPVSMVITHHDPSHVGGTAHALSIARDWEIPIFNFYKVEDQEALCDFVESFEG